MFSKKHRFFVLKKRYIILAACFLIAIVGGAIYFSAILPTFRPNTQKVIVIDAGHGGKDGGAVGKVSGVSESELNLSFAKKLKKLCQSFGFDVVLTRSDMEGLYSPTAENKKKSEMEKRRKIIEKSGADLVVSIHMNSFPSSQACGAQVYYADGSVSGQALADSVQTSLFKGIENSKKTAKVGDFYVLNCTDKPSILVECGFLSNPNEETLLQDESYQEKFCYILFCGILQFYNFKI